MFEFEELATSDPRWKDAISDVDHDIYHKPEYSAVEAERTGLRAVAGYVRWDSGALLVPYVIRPVPERPEVSDVVSPYGYSGALFVGESDLPTRRAAVGKLLAGMRELGYPSAFLRMHPIIDFANDAFPNDALSKIGEVVVADLGRSDDDLWHGLRAENRRRIRRSRDAGVEVVFDAPTHASIGDLADAYRETMDRVGASETYYTFDQAYFERLCDVLGPFLILGTVHHEGTVLSASLSSLVCTIGQGLLSGTRTAARSGNDAAHSSVMLYYKTMLEFKKLGAKTFNFGSGLGGQRDSLFAFKQSFSKDTRDYHSVNAVLDPAVYQSLISCRAGSLGVTPQDLAASSYFPAYRGGV